VCDCRIYKLYLTLSIRIKLQTTVIAKLLLRWISGAALWACFGELKPAVATELLAFCIHLLAVRAYSRVIPDLTLAKERLGFLVYGNADLDVVVSGLRYVHPD
jgi:hypothetical protein